jgi:replicative superfamily II helicase
MNMNDEFAVLPKLISFELFFEICSQALIFCATRRIAIQTANQLVKTLSERHESYVLGGQQQRALAMAVSKCKNQSLAELLRHGVGNAPKN